MGLSPSEVIEGYKMACKKALEILPCKCARSFWVDNVKLLNLVSLIYFIKQFNFVLYMPKKNCG